MSDIFNAPIIYLDIVDSTNNYAMQCIDADTAQNGTCIVAEHQTAGKGQRGKAWLDKPSEVLMWSTILRPKHALKDLFVFNAAVAGSFAACLQKICENHKIAVKWPNDIIINDKKAGGILIENVIRGNEWLYAIIGFGLNVLQSEFDSGLPHATSLAREGIFFYKATDVLEPLRATLFEDYIKDDTAGMVMERYNALLLGKGEQRIFMKSGVVFSATILDVKPDGKLYLSMPDGSIEGYAHGEVEWVW